MRRRRKATTRRLRKRTDSGIGAKNQKTYSTCKRRYIISAKVADESGNCWLTMFNDDGEKLFGYTADEMHQFRENDNDKFENILKEALFKSFTFKLKSKVEEYNNENRRRVLTMSMNPIDFAAESRSLLSKMGIEA